MIYLCGAMSRPKWTRHFGAMRDRIGMMLGPGAWRTPFTSYACDNGVFAAYNRILKGETTESQDAWWWRQGQANWFKLLDKIPEDNKPLFCVLPDIVTDWETTIIRAHQYRKELEGRGLKPALALQDGCNWKEVLDFEPQVVFVGGSTAWKWNNLRKIADTFIPRGIWVHVGRVNAVQCLFYCRACGVQSVDGTGIARHTDTMKPRILAGMYEDNRFSFRG